MRSSRSPWTSSTRSSRSRARSGRPSTSSSLKEAEENVNNLRMELALKTLQLELRLVFEYLEKEALQVR